MTLQLRFIYCENLKNLFLRYINNSIERNTRLRLYRRRESEKEISISSETSRPMTEAGLLACYDTSSRTYDTVYVEIVGSSSPRIAARGIRLVKVIVTRVRT